jgi:hypothetical protein
VIGILRHSLLSFAKILLLQHILASRLEHSSSFKLAIYTRLSRLSFRDWYPSRDIIHPVLVSSYRSLWLFSKNRPQNLSTSMDGPMYSYILPGPDSPLGKARYGKPPALDDDVRQPVQFVEIRRSTPTDHLR